jgi:hypothetical protein
MDSGLWEISERTKSPVFPAAAAGRAEAYREMVGSLLPRPRSEQFRSVSSSSLVKSATCIKAGVCRLLRLLRDAEGAYLRDHLILPPHSRTRSIRNLAPILAEPGTLARLDAV